MCSYQQFVFSLDTFDNLGGKSLTTVTLYDLENNAKPPFAQFFLHDKSSLEVPARFDCKFIRRRILNGGVRTAPTRHARASQTNTDVFTGRTSFAKAMYVFSTHSEPIQAARSQVFDGVRK